MSWQNSKRWGHAGTVTIAGLTVKSPTVPSRAGAVANLPPRSGDFAPPSHRVPLPSYNTIPIDLSSTGENPPGSPTGKMTLVFRANYLCMINATQPGGTIWLGALLNILPTIGGGDQIPFQFNSKLRGEVDRYQISWNVMAPGFTITLFVSRFADEINGLEMDAPPASTLIVAGSGTTLTASQVSVTTTAALLVAASSTRQQAIVKNVDPIQPIWIGSSAAVTPSNGFIINPGDEPVDVSGTTAAIWAVTENGTQPALVQLLVEQ